MNLPNKLTLTRIILVPVFMIFVSMSQYMTPDYNPRWYLIAGIIFAIASFTDYLDGHLARKWHMVTDFGKFADPLADKLLTTVAFLYMMRDGVCSPVVLCIILAREFAVSGLRMVAAGAKDGKVIAANMWCWARPALPLPTGCAGWWQWSRPFPASSTCGTTAASSTRQNKMKEKLWAFCRKLISLALNLSIIYMETIAMPISWDYGHELVFTMYTELSNMFNVAVCALVALCQVLDLFTGRELPRWVKQLKFWSTSCLTMTFLTVVFILAPMYEDGNGWYIMLFTGSMLYHHFLNPVVAMASFLLFEREPRLPLASVPLALVPTIVYGVYDLWGNITGRIDGPYPFMRVYDQTIQESLMWFAIILGTNLLYAFVLWWLGGNGKKHRKKGPKLEFMG